MASRTIGGGIETYRRASDGHWTFGTLGEEVDVHEEDLERFDRLTFVAPEPAKQEADDDETSEPFAGVSVADLKKLIKERNEGRGDDTKIVPAEPGNRPELVAALVADDARS